MTFRNLCRYGDIKFKKTFVVEIPFGILLSYLYSMPGARGPIDQRNNTTKKCTPSIHSTAKKKSARPLYIQRPHSSP